MTESWSREEVAATVADYFHMLTMEHAGTHTAKRRKRLRSVLKSDGLARKVVGYVGNAKPDFNYLTDDLAQTQSRIHFIAFNEGGDMEMIAQRK